MWRSATNNNLVQDKESPDSLKQKGDLIYSVFVSLSAE